MTDRFGAALSQHPVPAQAAGEVLGEVLEQVGAAPDLAVLFCTGPLVGALEDIVRTVRAVLNPRVLIGASAVSVVGGPTEVEESTGLSLWAGRFGVDIDPIRLDAFRNAEGDLIVAGGGPLQQPGGTLLLLGDPFSFPTEEMLGHFSEVFPELTVIGGLASSGRASGTNRLILDDEMWSDGAVGVRLPPTVEVSAVVSQGCRPIGSPVTVTRSERNVLYELASQPALERLEAVISGLDDDERRMAAAGLHIGRVIDERRETFVRGDFLIRGVLGADRSAGAVAVGDEIPFGSTVQFQVRDAVSADEDLVAAMTGQDAAAALLFTCNGRGERLFGAPDHDARVVSESLGRSAVAGMFCAGEIGPVGGRNFLHGFTASIALFG